jgi:alkylhydroperoxidase family enzyme
MTVRIPPVAPADNPSDLQKMLGGLTPSGSDRALNIFGTLAQHPNLLHDYLPFGSRLLLGGELPDRDREFVILVTAQLCECSYEWDHHVRMAKSAGLSKGEIEHISRGRQSDPWAPDDAALIAAVSELVSRHTVGDDTWEVLEARYSHRQLLELTMLVGHYAMLAGMLNAVGVEHDAIVDSVANRKDRS